MAYGFFHFVYNEFPLGVFYPEHSQLAFDYAFIACSLKSIWPGLAQGCKTPNGVDKACLITSLLSGLTH